jgi:DNA-binding transcriptional MerR regulator
MERNLPESMAPWLRAKAEPRPLVKEELELTVGEVASLVGVSVRTLHHWDAIGLVRPHGRTSGGHRAYSAADTGRIHRALVYRELGFALSQISSLLDDPAVDEVQQLRRQRGLLEERIGRLRRMTDAVDRILEARAAGATLTARQQAEIFGRGWREEWSGEAHGRWGDSEEWAQFERNAAVLSEADRSRMRGEGEALYADLGRAKRAGVAPESDEAGRLAERHREMIAQLFVCSRSMHVCLGRLFAHDERFNASFDEVEPGLAGWLTAAIDANARRNGIDPDRAAWE